MAANISLPTGFSSNLRMEPSGRRKEDATTGISAASTRAVAARAMAFYFRAPAKSFFRSRVDYMAFARAINPRIQANEPWSLATSTPGLLRHAVQTYGWSFIPKQVVPPFLANVLVGGVLYTTYLQTLAALHQPSSVSAKRAYPPPSFLQTFMAGLAAGSVQSIVAAPLDALHVRFRTSDLLSGRYADMWHYAWHRSREMGPRGIFAGWTLSWIKDGIGCAAFFATFEVIKSQGFYAFLAYLYGGQRSNTTGGDCGTGPTRSATPHYTVEPIFILSGGVSATIVQQAVQHPLGLVCEAHSQRIRALDKLARLSGSPRVMMKGYRDACWRTARMCARKARLIGGWGRWLYQGFWSSTTRSIPSTSAGLIIFELVRRRYADDTSGTKIDVDGNEIILT